MIGSPLGYVPFLRPGTLMFTALACGFLASGGVVEKHTLYEIYGRPGGRTRHLFGENVLSATRALFGDSLSPEEVLSRHTLFGIYSRALTQPSADWWAAEIIAGSATRWFRSPISLPSVRTNFRLATDELRSCASCMQRDVEENGFPSWHLIHLIPALHHCPYHGDLLVPEAWNTRDEMWSLSLPTGVSTGKPTPRLESASDGYVSYLRLWVAFVEGRLPIASSHNWGRFMHFVAQRLGDLDGAVRAISNQLMQSWSARPDQFPEMLERHVLPDFIKSELQYSTSHSRIAQKLVILTACDALGVLPPLPGFSEQLSIQFRQKIGMSATRFGLAQ